MPQTTSRNTPGQHLPRRLVMLFAAVAVLSFVLGFATTVTP
ncbi:hypothetical protein ACIBCR_15235 [Micromonospora echinospora]